MKPVTYVRPVTVIREQFVPSPQVQRALSKFVDGSPSTFRFYGSGQRVLDQWEYHRSVHDHALRSIRENLKAMGRGALLLSGRTHLLERPDGGARLLVEPAEQDQDRLDQLISLMQEVPSLEDVPNSPNHLYIDFARDSLTRNVQLRRDAADNFLAHARHPASRRVFSVSSPEIVVQDIQQYRLRASQPMREGD